MADDVERPFNLVLARKLIASSRHQLPPHMQAHAVETIATLRADLAKAVGGVERLELMATNHSGWFDQKLEIRWRGLNEIHGIAQSLIKELRP